jgi:hypothetical protein
LEDELDKDALSPILFNLYNEYLSKGTLEVFGGFKIGRQVNGNVKYADDLVLLAKEDALLQGITESLHEIGRCYGMEMNVEKPKVIRISRQPSAIQTTGIPRCVMVCYATIHNKDGCENRRPKISWTYKFFLKRRNNKYRV